MCGKLDLLIKELILPSLTILVDELLREISTFLIREWVYLGYEVELRYSDRMGGGGCYEDYGNVMTQG